MKKNDDFIEETWTGTCGNCDGSGMEECPICEGEGEATYHMGQVVKKY